jgi:hypothetical protein
MAHYLFNVPEGSQEQAAALLRVKMWALGRDEKHRQALAPADLALIYLAAPREIIGQATLASRAHDWTAEEAGACPGDSPGGVLLSHVEEWDRPVALSAVVQRIDPDGSNPYVQQNATAGFQRGVVLITADEYEAVMAVRAQGG